ncbi:unannotated protein [freshwater metagenome]|uniref:Unannotated protein n=1 Tax=freshwater metagenome TaxID=449393 RepID=A0A6J7FW69_9ZZZZ|nr:response regulator [Actinomycetota bacterium]
MSPATPSERRTVLLVDDDHNLRLANRRVLERARLDVLEAATGRDALRVLHERRPSCVVLDIGLPDIDGWTVLERIRDVSEIPVLILSGRALEEDKIRGLQQGADDYLCKPHSGGEFVARVHALLRRAPRDSEPPRSIYTDSLLMMDPSAHKVTVAEREVSLTPIEFRLLYALATHAGQVLSPAQLLELAWHDPTAIGPDRVKFALLRLRRKIDADANCTIPIDAVRSLGYRYTSPHLPEHLAGAAT